MKKILLISILSLLLLSLGWIYFTNLNHKNKNFDLSTCDLRDEYCGNYVTITGRAIDAKEGAMIDGEHGFVIVKGLEGWPSIFSQQKIIVSGFLEKKIWPDRGPYVAAPRGTLYYIELNSVCKIGLPE